MVYEDDDDELAPGALLDRLVEQIAGLQTQRRMGAGIGPEMGRFPRGGFNTPRERTRPRPRDTTSPLALLHMLVQGVAGAVDKSPPLQVLHMLDRRMASRPVRFDYGTRVADPERRPGSLFRQT